MLGPKHSKTKWLQKINEYKVNQESTKYSYSKYAKRCRAYLIETRFASFPKVQSLVLSVHDNSNDLSHDQEESKLNSTINANSCGYTCRWPNNRKSPFNKTNIATIKKK